MNKILYVGDPHVQVNNLQESEKLLQFVLDTAKTNKVNQITILGDLMHTHSVLRVQVVEFWTKWLMELSSEFNTVVLVGNHDALSNADLSMHALGVFKRLNNTKLQIVDSTHKIGPIGYMAYIHNNEEFVKKANELGTKVLVCHGEFSGSQYENGYFSPHGVNHDLLDATTVISGHIHKRQVFGKVIHPGTARWLTNSDANESKGLWLVEHDTTTGEIKSESYIDTSNVCTQIVKKTWVEGEDMPSLSENAKNTVELIGSSTWITKQKVLLKGKASITAKITDRNKPENRKTGNNLSDFISNIFETKLNKEDILNYLKEKDLV